ncbi:hypothetical protein NN561_000545 [Cricetulus griseus]
MGPAQKRTRPSGSGPAAALPQALRLQPPGPPKAAAGSPTPSPPDAASEPERPGRGGPNGGSPPANRRRKPARSPPPPPRRSPRARGGAYLTAGQAPPIAPPGGRRGRSVLERQGLTSSFAHGPRWNLLVPSGVTRFPPREAGTPPLWKKPSSEEGPVPEREQDVRHLHKRQVLLRLEVPEDRPGSIAPGLGPRPPAMLQEQFALRSGASRL